MNNLKALAKPYVALNGQATLWYMPYQTLQAMIIFSAFEEMIPRTQWTGIHSVYLLFAANVVDIDFSYQVEATPQERALQVYWQGRTGNVKEDWLLFLTLPPQMLSELQNGYDATRDTALVSPNGASADPQLESATDNG